MQLTLIRWTGARDLSRWIARLAKRAALRVRIEAEYWALKSDQEWMAACERDGIAGTASMNAWRAECSARSCRIAMLESDLRRI